MKLPEEPIFNYVIFVIAILLISFAVVSVKFFNVRNELKVLKSKCANETTKI